jgi:hypothetical protein
LTYHNQFFVFGINNITQSFVVSQITRGIKISVLYWFERLLQNYTRYTLPLVTKSGKCTVIQSTYISTLGNFFDSLKDIEIVGRRMVEKKKKPVLKPD